MTIEDKREWLVAFCNDQPICEGCLLHIPELKCGRGQHYSFPSSMSSGDIELAYSIAFSPADQSINDADTAYKADNGKLRLDLVSPKIIEEIGKVRTFGAQKYGDNDGWKKVGVQRYEAALLRHLNEYRKGNYIDEESGLSHLAHIACNLMFIMDLEGEDDKGKT